jgi:hypothetical protein
VLVEVEDLAEYFAQPQSNSLHPLLIALKKLYIHAYKGSTDKAFDLGKIRSVFVDEFSYLRRYSAVDVCK